MIPNFAFYRTPGLRFGAGEFRNSARHAACFGKNLLIVIGRSSLRTSGRLGRLCDCLEQDAFRYAVVEIETEPSPEQIDAIVSDFRDKNISLVIGVGGGSVIDAGKAVAAMLSIDGSVYDYLEGVGRKPFTGGTTAYLAMPTTAGTGSEATANAVLSRVAADGFKKSLRHDSLVPDLAVIDPELLLSCPREVSAACGMDALSQLLESYVSTQASPITDSLALSGLEYLSQSLVSACTTGRNDLAVRARTAYASFISGVTLANAGLGVVHGMAASLGGFFAIPHGVVCGSLLAPSIRITIDKLKGAREESETVLRKFAAVGMLLRKCSPGDVEGGCEALVVELYDLTERLEIPRLSDFGVTLSDIDRIVEKSGNKNNPVALSRNEMAMILRERISSG
ncbi:MAG: iron-containing alcohol dehydrogenase [Deltaproteobacteria bacterium]|nr:iron-containing alcohol dehydrogenase [Deltaproteobacteria bacterium]